jgi:membrane-associated protease RseP (regulator of RpoE activity)
MKNNNVILTPKAQWSLIFFLGSFALNIASMWLIGSLSKSADIHAFIIFIPPLLTVIIYLISAILGVASLKTSKFPLLWVIPCLIMGGTLGITAVADLSRFSKLTSTTISHSASINPGKAIGVTISRSEETPTLVEAVLYKSPAENSGIINGDTILSIEGIPVHSRNDIVNALNQIENTIVQVNVRREGQNKSIIVSR